MDVSHFGLLEHPLHQLLGHTLPDGEQDEDGDQGEHDENGDQDDDGDLEADWGPPVSIEGADEAKVEAVVVRQLATDCSGLGRGSIEKLPIFTFFQKYFKSVGNRLLQSEDKETLNN